MNSGQSASVLPAMAIQVCLSNHSMWITSSLHHRFKIVTRGRQKTVTLTIGQPQGIQGWPSVSV